MARYRSRTDVGQDRRFLSALFSGADYAWNPGAFDADKSWEASLAAIVKTDRYTDALKQFIRLLSAYTTKDTTTPLEPL